MRLLSVRSIFLLLIATGIVVYSAAWLALGSFEKRSVPHDFNHRYLPIAHGIGEGGDFLLNGRAPSPPIYPLVLAGLSKLGALFNIDEETSARAFNVLAMILLAVLFYSFISRHLNERTAFLAALLWITYPFAVYLTLLPGPEPLYLLALVLSAWTTVEARRAGGWETFAAGATSALPMLVKPMALFLPVAWLGFLFITWIKGRVSLERFALCCLLFIAGLLIVVLPWEAYLWQRTGKLVPVADKAGSAIYDGWTFGLNPGAGGDRVFIPEDVEKFMRGVERFSQGKGSGEVISAVRREARERPVAFLKVLFIKLGRCWYGTDEMWHERLILSIQAFYLLLATIGAILWFRQGRPGGALAAVLLILLLYHWAAATAALSILRYMVPAGFLMAVMIGFGGVQVWRYLPKKI